MGTTKDNSFFSESEQKHLHLFLDTFEDQTNANIQHTNEATPILLSSPYSQQYTNSIKINPLNITPHKVTKKYQQKKPYSPPSSSSDEQNKRKPTARKLAHELLSEDQKRANHIASEQKRRANIRIGFEKLVDIVPTLSSGHKSEALILQKSVEHLRQLVEHKTKLKEKARELQMMLGEIPDEDSSDGEIDFDF